MSTQPSKQTNTPAVELRIQRYFELCRISVELALEGIRHDSPDLDAAARRRKLRQRLALYRRGKWATHE